jgi:hypothetical protein
MERLGFVRTGVYVTLGLMEGLHLMRGLAFCEDWGEQGFM